MKTTYTHSKIQEVVNASFMKLLGYVPQYRIEYKKIGRGIAGLATYETNTLTFDPFFIEQNTNEYIASTVPHEVAHLACKILYPNAKQHHGPEWRHLMDKLGVDSSRFHTYNTHNAPGMHPRNHQYTCACEGRVFSLTKRMHTSIENGVARHCVKCKQTIKFIGVNT